MTRLIQRLEQSRDIYLDCLAGVDANEACWRSGAERWSILDCAEHVANVEHRIFRTLQKAPPISQPGSAANRDERIYRQVCSREQRVPAPEFVRPCGRYASVEQAAAAFAGNRERAIAFLKVYTADLRAIGAVHPLLGPCNGYEYALIMAGHPIRHADQVREIREAYRAR